MKTLISLFCIHFLSISFFAQNKVIDSAQVTISNRVNSSEAENKPYVILISVDGFRFDYPEKYHAAHLLELQKQGVRARAMLPSYPSITGPNHYSIITGLYPSHHGMVDNNFYDYKRKESYYFGNKANVTDGSWLGGIPLWSLAEQQGVLSASMMWVAANSDAGGLGPTYFFSYDSKITPSEKVDKVVDWLQLPAKERPHFISLYFPETDASGHNFGPDSPQTREAVLAIDKAIGELVDKVGKLNLDNVNFIFVSDHGMYDVDGDNPIDIPALLLDENRFNVVNSQTLVRVEVKNKSEVKQVYKELKKNRTKEYQVYLAEKFPKNLHYRTKDDYFNRMGQIFLVPKAPKIFLFKDEKTSEGKHGYNAYKVPEMKAVFFAWGTKFKKGLQIKEFENVNIYPLVAHILELNYQNKIDGQLKVLDKILKN